MSLKLNSATKTPSGFVQIFQTVQTLRVGATLHNATIINCETTIITTTITTTITIIATFCQDDNLACMPKSRQTTPPSCYLIFVKPFSFHFVCQDTHERRQAVECTVLVARNVVAAGCNRKMEYMPNA